MISMNRYDLAPLRSLDDFLLQSARFQLPNFNDFDRWSNRIQQNLVYYQSNYFLMMLAIFLLIGTFHPSKVILGFLSTILLGALFIYATTEQQSLQRFKRQRPILSFFLVSTLICSVVHLMGFLLAYLYAVFVPILAVIIHASLRLRNVRNKIANKMYSNGNLKMTPMVYFLNEFLGVSVVLEKLQPKHK